MREYFLRCLLEADLSAARKTVFSGSGSGSDSGSGGFSSSGQKLHLKGLEGVGLKERGLGSLEEGPAKAFD